MALWKRIARASRDQRGLETVEWVAMMFAALMLLLATALVFRDQAATLGDAALEALGRFINGVGLGGQAVNRLTPQPLTITTVYSALGVPGLVTDRLDAQTGGCGFLWLGCIGDTAAFLGAAAMGFLATLALGVVAALVVGAALFLIGIVSVKAALIAGAVLLIAAIGYTIYTRLQQFAERNVPWYQYPLVIPLAIGDIIGVTGIIEGLSGRDLVTGAQLTPEEAGQRLGSGLAGLLLTLVTGGTARSGAVGSNAAARSAGIRGVLSRLNPLPALGRVRVKLPNGQVLGWGGFDISISKQWSIKRSFTPWDKQVIREIATRITQMPEFNPKTWPTLSPAQQHRAARRLVDIVMDVHGIPKSRWPKFEFKPMPQGNYGSAQWILTNPRGTLKVNSNNAVGDIIGTIVHEGRHYFQYWQAYQVNVLNRNIANLHPHAPKWIQNLPKPIGTYYPWTHPKYLTQPVEVDAESFGRRVIDLLPIRWPKLVTPPVVPTQSGNPGP